MQAVSILRPAPLFGTVAGETLATRLARGPLPLDDLLRYAIEVADANC